MRIVERPTHGALEITTAKICSVNCAPHCPQMKFRGVYTAVERMLPYDDFVKAIDTVPTDVFITFAGFSEPFMNNRALDMMEYARKKGHRLKVFSTLVGLRPDQVQRFADVAPDVFSLHEPDNRDIANIPLTDTYKETYFKVLKSLDIHLHSRMDGAFVSNQRAGNCDGAPPIHVRGPFYCQKLVEPEFVLLPNCDAVLCCMDWVVDHPIGNLLRSSWDDLIASEAYQAVVRNSWKMDGNTLCRSCTYAVPTFSGSRAVIGVRHVAERLGFIQLPTGQNAGTNSPA